MTVPRAFTCSATPLSLPLCECVGGDLGMEQDEDEKKTQEEERKEEEPARFHLERPKKSDSSTPTKKKVEKLFAIRGLLSRSHRLSVLPNL